MSIENNPTGRLLELMSVARKIPDSLKSRKAWSTIFQCEEDDTGSLLQGIAGLIRLVDEAREATRAHVPGDPTIFMAPFLAIEMMLSRLSMESTWANSKALITDTVISALQFGSHTLAIHYSDKSLGDERLKEILNSINSLLEECIGADLPESLKQFFAHNLDCLRKSLVSYRISGVHGLQEELDRLAGNIFRHKDEVDAARESTATRDITARFFEVIAKVNDSVQIVQSACALAAPLTLLLGVWPKG